MSDLTKKLEALSRYSPFVNGTAFMGMLRKMGEKRYGPGFSPDSYGEYILASDVDALLASEAREEPGAMADVLAERKRQDAKWGDQNHDPIVYTTILTEEVGELAQAALHARFGGDKKDGLRTEAIHCAAVALAIVECIDRDKWQWPKDAPHDN